MINEWNKLPNDCVNASSVNIFKNRIDKGGLHIDEKIVGLSISQWLPCPLCHLELVDWDGNLVKSCYRGFVNIKNSKELNDSLPYDYITYRGFVNIKS